MGTPTQQIAQEAATADPGMWTALGTAIGGAVSGAWAGMRFRKAPENNCQGDTDRIVAGLKELGDRVEKITKEESERTRELFLAALGKR